jgi:hypothetical protein
MRADNASQFLAGWEFSLCVCPLCQLIDERLCNRGSAGAAVDDLVVSNIFAVESFVSGLIALERRAVTRSGGFVGITNIPMIRWISSLRTNETSNRCFGSILTSRDTDSGIFGYLDRDDQSAKTAKRPNVHHDLRTLSGTSSVVSDRSMACQP